MTDARFPSLTRLAVLLEGSTSDAEQQLPWATLLCRSLGLSLTLLHVVDPARTGEPPEIAIAEASDYLRLIADTLAKEPEPLPVTIEVREGLPDEEWAEFSAANPECALMLPAWGGSGLLQALRLRRLEDLAVAFTSPVIIVPLGSEAPAEIERIIVGTDGSELADAVFEFVRLALGPGRDLIEVQAVERGAIPDHQFLQLHPAISDSRVSIRGAAGPTILAVARQRSAQLIFVGSHNKGRNILTLILGSTSQWLTRHSDRPVVVVPDVWIRGK
jgi:nucleotide-binding universal stress UspA family protein